MLLLVDLILCAYRKWLGLRVQTMDVFVRRICREERRRKLFERERERERKDPGIEPSYLE